MQITLLQSKRVEETLCHSREFFSFAQHVCAGLSVRRWTAEAEAAAAHTITHSLLP